MKMNATRFAATAAKVARDRIEAGIPGRDEVVTGTVQRADDGSAWVHVMVFVAPVDIEEEIARGKEVQS